MSAAALVKLMRTPECAPALSVTQWNGIISAARAERLLGTLAVLLENVAVPDAVRAILADARRDAEREQRIALWEANRAAQALAPLGLEPILLKGAAYAAAGLRAGKGRMIGDLDILVPRDRLEEAEAALLAAGWEWVKPDPYDDAYYRRWMHELPPLIHRDRDRMIDVHHTILPLTAQPRPDAAALIAQSVEIGGGLRVLSPEHRIIHAVAHLFADGDLSGGLRNLWDIDQLCRELSEWDKHFILSLFEEAWCHQLWQPLRRALVLANCLFGLPLMDYHTPMVVRLHRKWTDCFFERRLLATDEWGRDSRKWLGLAFYIRSHLLRMPPLLLIRHLFTKWRKGHRPV